MPNKIYISGKNQIRTVTPSNIQQTITPQEGFNALDAVVVNPIKAAMPQTLDQYIMRDNNMEPFSLNLDGDIPSYACYRQERLVAVYGTPTSIGVGAFDNCINLQEIDLSQVVSIASNAFSAAGLVKIECPIVSSIQGNAFASMPNLQKADCPNVTSVGNSVFSNCKNLKTVDLRTLPVVGNGLCQSSTALKAVDVRSATAINNSAFVYCTALLLLDLTNTSNATLANTSSLPNNANLVILVANDTDKAYYQSATNWSAHASKIKTVAEYEQQIGMSYDDYYEIIFGHPRFDNQEATS